MMSQSKATLAAAALIFVTVAAAAQDRLPSLDVEKNCRSRANASGPSMGDKTVTAELFTACMRSEREAQEALSAAWKDVPANYRSMCIRPSAFSPSYAEWIACLEMNMDVKKLRSKN